jgi:hypothetical protein
MKADEMRPTRVAALWGVLLLIVCLAGCASKRTVDWGGRVGHYTYDEAVLELGPPDKVAELSDGSQVAEWRTGRRSGGVSFGMGTGFSSGRTGVGVGQTVHSGGGGVEWLQLTFDADGVLTQWSPVRR